MSTITSTTVVPSAEHQSLLTRLAHAAHVATTGDQVVTTSTSTATAVKTVPAFDIKKMATWGGIGAAASAALGGVSLLTKFSLPLLGKVTSLAGIAKFGAFGGIAGLAIAAWPAISPRLDGHPAIKAAVTGAGIGAAAGSILPVFGPISGAIAGAVIGAGIHLLRHRTVTTDVPTISQPPITMPGAPFVPPAGYVPLGSQRPGFFARLFGANAQPIGVTNGYAGYGNLTPAGYGSPYGNPYGGMPVGYGASYPTGYGAGYSTGGHGGYPTMSYGSYPAAAYAGAPTAYGYPAAAYGSGTAPQVANAYAANAMNPAAANSAARNGRAVPTAAAMTALPAATAASPMLAGAQVGAAPAAVAGIGAPGSPTTPAVAASKTKRPNRAKAQPAMPSATKKGAKKAPTKKAPTKKSTTKHAPVKKAPVKKTSPHKATLPLKASVTPFGADPSLKDLPNVAGPLDGLDVSSPIAGVASPLDAAASGAAGLVPGAGAQPGLLTVDPSIMNSLPNVQVAPAASPLAAPMAAAATASPYPELNAATGVAPVGLPM